MDAFTREFGTEQGRIQPADFTPPEGQYVFCLGADREGLLATFEPGDYVEVAQTADFGDGAYRTRVVSVSALLRCPLVPTLSPQPWWEFQVRVDGTARAKRKLNPRRGKTHERTLTNVAVSVADLTVGTRTLAFRLALVTS